MSKLATKLKTLWFVIFGRRSGLSIDDRVFIKHSLEQRDLEMEENFLAIVDKKYAEQTDVLAEIINTQFVNILAEMKNNNRRIRKLENRADNTDKRIDIIEQKLVKIA